jgi:hypothetical protein
MFSFRNIFNHHGDENYIKPLVVAKGESIFSLWKLHIGPKEMNAECSNKLIICTYIYFIYTSKDMLRH